ncbi:flagellar biosynthetic protein FliO [Marinilactibacillus psychrotolerans]|uniref:flagellar biosynthetic protein FliO n=1 Tax=Marinilactibacillus psychrotolerans TaxID=191770 RepID=UPI0039AFF6FE
MQGVGVDQFIQMLFALLLIIILANFLLKRLDRMNQVRSKAIKIIERVPVSKSSSLCIVQVGAQYMLMSFSEHGNEVIKEFSQQEKEEIQIRLHQKAENTKNITDIKKISGDLKSKYKHLKKKYEDSFKGD